MQACCSDVRRQRAAASTVDLLITIRYPPRRGRTLTAWYGWQFSGRLHCWTSVWVPKTGLNRTAARFELWREKGSRAEPKCLSDESLRSPEIRWNCVRQKEAREKRQEHKKHAILLVYLISYWINVHFYKRKWLVAGQFFFVLFFYLVPFCSLLHLIHKNVWKSSTLLDLANPNQHFTNKLEDLYFAQHS